MYIITILLVIDWIFQFDLLFGVNEKWETKFEDLVKKLEERLSDIEDKQDSDYESNKKRFADVEDKMEDLGTMFNDQQQRYEEEIKDLRFQLDEANMKPKETLWDLPDGSRKFVHYNYISYLELYEYHRDM